MKTEQDFDVDELISEWQSDDGPSLSRVKSDVRKGLIRSRITLLLETGVALAGFIAGVMLVRAGDGLVGVGAITFSVFGGGAALYARGRSWRVPINSVSDEIETLEREVRMTQRAGWAGLAVSVAAMAFLSLVLVDSSAPFIDQRSKTVMIASFLFILVSGATSIRMSMNARRRADRLRATRNTISRRE